MKKLALIIGAACRSQARWAKTHVYAWAILTPLVLGITYLSASRVASNLSASQISFSQTLFGAVSFCALLVALNLSSASAELYHVRRPESYFEVLPVSADTHLLAALAARLLRTLVVGAGVLSLRWLVKESLTLYAVLPLLLFAALVAVIEVFAAMNWIHWGHTKEKLWAGLTLLIGAPAVVLAGWLLAFGIKAVRLRYEALLPLTMAAIVLLALASQRLHQRWRALDIEYARRLQTPGRASIPWEALWRRRLAPGVAAQLARDIQLTIRGFSSAVYVIVCLGAALLVALFAALTTGLWPPITGDFGWLDVMRAEPVTAIKIACALLTTALSSLLPVLVAYEAPYLWLERAAGTSGLEMYQAKLAYARMISLPGALLAFLAGALTNTVPVFYLPLLFVECLLLWWGFSSLIGALSFEMPTRPGLALILMLTIGVGGGIAASLALLTSAFVLLGFYFYAQMMHGLTERGRARAKYFLMFGDD